MLITYIFCLVIYIGKVVSRRACRWRTRQFQHLQSPFPLQILPRKSIKSVFLASVVLVDISRGRPVHTSFFPCVSAFFPRGNASSLILIYCVKAVPGVRTQTTLPLSPPRRSMAPPSVDNGKVKKDITKLITLALCPLYKGDIYCKWYVIMFGLWLLECFPPPL